MIARGVFAIERDDIATSKIMNKDAMGFARHQIPKKTPKVGRRMATECHSLYQGWTRTQWAVTIWATKSDFDTLDCHTLGETT